MPSNGSTAYDTMMRRYEKQYDELKTELLGLYREWIENNRELERLVKEMRRVSSRVLALITGRQAP